MYTKCGKEMKWTEALKIDARKSCIGLHICSFYIMKNRKVYEKEEAQNICALHLVYSKAYISHLVPLLHFGIFWYV